MQKLTTKSISPVIKTGNKVITKKNEKCRVYGYTTKTNDNWIKKNSKAFGSKAKFLDAMITAARKTKLEITAPLAKKTIKK